MTRRRYAIYTWTIYADVLTWVIVLIAWAIAGQHLRWHNLGLWFDWRRPVPRWYRGWGGTCLGHAGWLAPDMPEIVQRHEDVHVIQYEIAMFCATVCALLCLATYLLGVWWLGPVLCYASGWALKAAAGWLVAWLRGGDPYLDAEHERSAYAQIALEEITGRELEIRRDR